MTKESREAELAEKRQYWKQHLEEWGKSGLSQVAYCRQHDLSHCRFQYWKKKYQPAKPVDLIELKLHPAHEKSGAHTALRLIVGNYQVAVQRNFDPVALGQLTAVLSRL